MLRSCWSSEIQHVSRADLLFPLLPTQWVLPVTTHVPLPPLEIPSDIIFFTSFPRFPLFSPSRILQLDGKPVVHPESLPFLSPVLLTFAACYKTLLSFHRVHTLFIVQDPIFNSWELWWWGSHHRH